MKRKDLYIDQIIYIIISAGGINKKKFIQPCTVISLDISGFWTECGDVCRFKYFDYNELDIKDYIFSNNDNAKLTLKKK